MSIKNPCDNCIVDPVCLIACTRYKNFIQKVNLFGYNKGVDNELICNYERYIRLIKLDFIAHSPQLYYIVWSAKFHYDKNHSPK